MDSVKKSIIIIAASLVVLGFMAYQAVANNSPVAGYEVITLPDEATGGLGD